MPPFSFFSSKALADVYSSPLPKGQSSTEHSFELYCDASEASRMCGGKKSNSVPATDASFMLAGQARSGRSACLRPPRLKVNVRALPEAFTPPPPHLPLSGGIHLCSGLPCSAERLFGSQEA